MSETTTPKFNLDAFNCPICGAYSKQEWSYAQGFDMRRAMLHGLQISTFHIKNYAFSLCTHCNKIAIWNTEKQSLVFPKVTMRSFDLTEVPKNLANDYSEACLVLADSPKASAALSRRCLQSLLREQGFNDKSLYKEIQLAIDSNSLPSHIVDSIDAIRNIGNFAAHPLKDTNTGEIVEVEPGESEWNLEVLESLFDFYYLQPAKTKKRKDALNEKLKAMGKDEIK